MIRFKSVLWIIAGWFLVSSLGCCFAKSDIKSAPWIWSDLNDPAPKNRFTYFRKVVQLHEIPEDATLRFAADSNARLWINGNLVRRKVARYHEEKITAEVVNAAPYLKTGKNVVVVLHHNWGNIITFQRTGNRHAGLYLDSSWIRTDTSWRWQVAPGFMPHDKQVKGVIGDDRIRYPMIIDGGKVVGKEIHRARFDNANWKQAVVVNNGPWPARPNDVETPGQREYPVRPAKVLAVGIVESDQAISDDPLSMAKRIRLAQCKSQPKVARRIRRLLKGQPAIVQGNAGETKYITFDFHLPVHGYPFLKLKQATEGVLIDFGYAEIFRSIYSGEKHVDLTGWLNPEGVVGPGYADRYKTKAGKQFIELPDERTARWLTLHIHFIEDGKVSIEDVGIVKSQYPIEIVGSFQCGNEYIDQIIKLCLIHAEVTMSDSYVDTPGREDGQWIEDARLRAMIAASWFNDTKLREFMIRTHAEAQGKDGNLHPFAPSNYPAYPAGYDWSVQWVATLYDQYMWTGDTKWIERYWPQLQKYWQAVLKLVDEKGLWRTNHIFADIRVGIKLRKPHQSSGIVTPWIIERLRWSADMANAIGQEEQAKKWTTMAEGMTKAYRKYHIAPANGGIPAHIADLYDSQKPEAPRGYSQAGQTVAVYANLLTREEALVTLNYAFPEPDGSPPAEVTRWNNPTYCYRSLKALSHVGLTDRAIRHMIERYAPYLPGHPQNFTPLRMQSPFGGPLPEYWVSREDLNLEPGQVNPAQPRDETGSHGWQSVSLMWLHDTLLGVQITEPGGGKLRIAPQSGGLPYVQGHTNTPKGLVWVSWDPQQWRLEVQIPDDVIAEVILPEECKGKRVTKIESTATVKKINTMTFEIQSSGRSIFQVR